MFAAVVLCVCSLFWYGACVPAPKATDAEIRTISDQIWAADTGRITGTDVQYNINGPQLFTYVNEARFTGTYQLFINLLDNYTPQTGVAEACGTPCTTEEDAFLDGIVASDPMKALYEWLFGQGLAGATLQDFKEELRQYWFTKYTRSGGPLDSSGFENTFVGEIANSAVSGMHSWVQWYFEEQRGNFVYGSHFVTCDPEIESISFNWLGYYKSLDSTFIRSSLEAEMALYTLCLLTRPGNACPVQLGGIQLTLTVRSMSGLPLTVSSAFPNCN